MKRAEKTMCGTPANCLARPEAVMEGVRVRWIPSPRRRAGRLVSSCSLCASQFPWPGLGYRYVQNFTFQANKDRPFFVEDENEPEIIPGTSQGREIRWHTLHEVGVSATGTWAFLLRGVHHRARIDCGVRTAKDFIHRLLETGSNKPNVPHRRAPSPLTGPLH